ncbi:MAG: hypothetical protein KA165_04690 [Saprospiraceae bacterium]|nr:hypothetical protein [Saprospiraceae bacterium]
MKNTIRISTILLLSILCISSLQAQKKKVTNLKGCAYAGQAKSTVEFDLAATPNSEAQKYLDTILAVSHLPKTAIFLRTSDVQNAVATIIDGQRYILYNTEFLKKFKQDAKTKWAAYSILAHEVGHHVNAHTFEDKKPDERSKMEFAADDYAGRVLRSLCATRDDAQAGIRTLEGQATPPGYPPATARKIRTGQAFDEQDGLYKQGIIRDPCKDEFIEKPLSFGKNIPGNIARDAIARISKEKVEINFEVPYDQKRSKVYTNVLMQQNAEFQRINNFKWLENPFAPGPSKKMVWDYKKDGYTYDQVKKLDLLGIGSFDKNPAPTTSLELTGWSAMTAVGLGATTWGALSWYNARYTGNYVFYKNNRSLSSYTPPTQRQAMYDGADKKYRKGQVLMAIGVPLLTFGIIKLIKRWKRNSRDYILIPNLPSNL